MDLYWEKVVENILGGITTLTKPTPFAKEVEILKVEDKKKSRHIKKKGGSVEEKPKRRRRRKNSPIEDEVVKAMKSSSCWSESTWVSPLARLMGPRPASGQRGTGWRCGSRTSR
eukprot:TRINITY_DN18642_c0_g1_i1.p2 TRINITY_DN18642_c0_g1~~TRINITY_DN18642_c0_g1_i1.p2  ORF type:complete len:114 (-),score=20.79 TRINITY_DN18642_c0_g1_i1:155-496(-)